MKLADLRHLEFEPMVRFKEEIVEGESYTIVSYMISEKELWDAPLALEIRGITFHTATGQCVCRPFEKFFNVGERQDTATSLIKGEIESVFYKRDGSMITPVLLPSGKIVFKTKKSFYSDVAVLANEIVPDQVLKCCELLLSMGYTPIWEFTHPDHKIVINYQGERHFTLLAARHIESGRYMKYSDICQLQQSMGCDDAFNNFSIIGAVDKTWDEIEDSIANDTGIEGYVLLLKNGTRVKYKTKWYLSLHRTMTELRYRDIAEAVILETVDDVKSLVASQGIDILKIEEIEAQVNSELKFIRNEVQMAVHNFIGETFKDIALQLNGSPYFGMVMRELRGQRVDYIDFWKKHYLKKYSLRVVYNDSFSR